MVILIPMETDLHTFSDAPIFLYIRLSGVPGVINSPNSLPQYTVAFSVD